jgi:hypothetical protein
MVANRVAFFPGGDFNTIFSADGRTVTAGPATSANPGAGARGTPAASNRVYYEVEPLAPLTPGEVVTVGISTAAAWLGAFLGDGPQAAGVRPDGTFRWSGNSTPLSNVSFGAGSTVGIAIDQGRGLMWVTTDGVTWNSGNANPVNGVGGVSFLTGAAWYVAWATQTIGKSVKLPEELKFAVPGGFNPWGASLKRVATLPVLAVAGGYTIGQSPKVFVSGAANIPAGASFALDTPGVPTDLIQFSLVQTRGGTNVAQWQRVIVPGGGYSLFYPASAVQFQLGDELNLFMMTGDNPVPAFTTYLDVPILDHLFHWTFNHPGGQSTLSSFDQIVPTDMILTAAQWEARSRHSMQNQYIYPVLRQRRGGVEIANGNMRGNATVGGADGTIVWTSPAIENLQAGDVLRMESQIYTDANVAYQVWTSEPVVVEQPKAIAMMMA